MKYSTVFTAACIGASAIQLTAAQRMMYKRRLPYEDTLAERSIDDAEIEGRGLINDWLGNYEQVSADDDLKKYKEEQLKASSHNVQRDLSFEELDARELNFDEELALRDLHDELYARELSDYDGLYARDNELEARNSRRDIYNYDDLYTRDLDYDQELALRSLEEDVALSLRGLSDEDLMARFLGIHPVKWAQATWRTITGQHAKQTPVGGSDPSSTGAPSNGGTGTDGGSGGGSYRRSLYEYDALEARDFDYDEELALRGLEEEDYLVSRQLFDDELDARELFDEELDARDLFDEELDAREFFDEELDARDFFDEELDAREFFDAELDAREFDELDTREFDIDELD
ncbi:hypothetical protein H0H92_015918 [Tricholoma furcatifolium]|nr:hypothetical protein H0H92_015918 [Tricholoma furcatifolium]